jgi:hypothetical protein
MKSTDIKRKAWKQREGISSTSSSDSSGWVTMWNHLDQDLLLQDHDFTPSSLFFSFLV